MKRRVLLSLVVGFAMVASAPEARAEDSSKGPLYIQSTVLGLGYLNLVGQSGANWAGYRPDFELGYHFSGRHDGFVIGARQSFALTLLPGKAGAASELRLGYDIPFKLSGFEVVAAPYAMIGAGYSFDGPSAGVRAAGGLEAKMFFTDSLYAHLRPIEAGVQCFHDAGECGLSMAFGAGVGVALGK